MPARVGTLIFLFHLSFRFAEKYLEKFINVLMCFLMGFMSQKEFCLMSLKKTH